MSTVTATCYAKEPQRNEKGINTRIGQIDDDLTAASVIKMFRLPDRAVVINAGVSRDSAQGDLAMGISGDADLFVATLSSSGMGVMNYNDGLNYQLSLSDDVIVKETDVIITVTSASHTGTIKAFIQYIMDERS
jgi:hypothetical protein